MCKAQCRTNAFQHCIILFHHVWLNETESLGYCHISYFCCIATTFPSNCTLILLEYYWVRWELHIYFLHNLSLFFFYPRAIQTLFVYVSRIIREIIWLQRKREMGQSYWRNWRRIWEKLNRLFSIWISFKGSVKYSFFVK